MKRIDLVFFTSLLFLTSCEGFKVLTLTNASGKDATVTVKPGIEKYDDTKISHYPVVQSGDSLTVVLPSDSSMVLLSVFTTMIGGAKIKPHDLHIDYLKIQSAEDTITADTKEEILALLRDDRTRYRSRTDKPMTNGKNFGNIMIRR